MVHPLRPEKWVLAGRTWGGQQGSYILHSRPLGFYECEWRLFGLMNSLATFQCLMKMCLDNLQFRWCIIYLDDIIIFGAMPKEHLKRLLTVLSWLWVVRLKLQPAKCKFFKTSVVYLGHGFSKVDICTNCYKVKAITNWPISIMVTELWNFWMFSSYYRHFIKGYAIVVYLLYDHISSDNATHKKWKIQWIEECQEVSDMLKVLCTSASISAFSDFTLPFKLHTDASTMGLGAILYQRHDGKDSVM